MSHSNDHDLLIELNVKVTEVLRRLDNQDSRMAQLEAKVDKDLSGMGVRLSALENFRWFILGGAAVVGFAAGFVGKFL